MTLLYIFIGGGIGSILRYGIGLVLPSDKFPFGVLVCNLVGCYLIGLVAGSFEKPSDLQIVMMTGVLGGFTTFSSFSDVSLKMFQSGSILAAMSHILISVLGGLVLTYLGYQTAVFFSKGSV